MRGPRDSATLSLPSDAVRRLPFGLCRSRWHMLGRIASRSLSQAGLHERAPSLAHQRVISTGRILCWGHLVAGKPFSDLRIWHVEGGDIELHRGPDKEGGLVLTLEELTEAMRAKGEWVPIRAGGEMLEGERFVQRTAGQFRLSAEASVTIAKDEIVLTKGDRTLRLNAKDLEKVNYHFYGLPFGVWYETSTIRLGRYAHELQRLLEQPEGQHTVTSLLKVLREGATLLPLIHSRLTTLRSSVELNLFDHEEEDYIV